VIFSGEVAVGLALSPARCVGIGAYSSPSLLYNPGSMTYTPMRLP